MAPAVVYKIQYGTATAGILDSPAKSTSASVELSDTVGIEEVTDMMHEAMHSMGVPDYLVVESAAAAADAEAAKTMLDVAKQAEADRHKAAEAKLAALTKKEAERHAAAEAKLAAAEKAAKAPPAASIPPRPATPAHPGATPARP